MDDSDGFEPYQLVTAEIARNVRSRYEIPVLPRFDRLVFSRIARIVRIKRTDQE